MSRNCTSSKTLVEVEGTLVLESSCPLILLSEAGGQQHNSGAALQARHTQLTTSTQFPLRNETRRYLCRHGKVRLALYI